MKFIKSSSVIKNKNISTQYKRRVCTTLRLKGTKSKIQYHNAHDTNLQYGANQCMLQSNRKDIGCFIFIKVRVHKGFIIFTPK
jgi:hypothetical protein